MILLTKETLKANIDYYIDMAKKGEIIKILDDDVDLTLSKVEED